RSARRFVHDPGGVDRVVDEAFLAGMREMHATAGYARAYASTVRALADVRAHRPAALLDRLAATRLPVLLIWGEEDRLLPPARARAAARPPRRAALLAGRPPPRLPVLLIWGEEDRLLPVDRARAAVRRLPGARLEMIEGAGHTPQAERPDRFNRALEDFLA